MPDFPIWGRDRETLVARDGLTGRELRRVDRPRLPDGRYPVFFEPYRVVLLRDQKIVDPDREDTVVLGVRKAGQTVTVMLTPAGDFYHKDEQDGFSLENSLKLKLGVDFRFA
jgi:hypothetical protein